MFQNDTPRDNIKKNDNKIREVSIRLTAIQREIEDLFNELGMTPEELQSYLSMSENFTPEEWQEIQNKTKETEMKLAEGDILDADPRETKKKRNETGQINNTWLFVR